MRCDGAITVDNIIGCHFVLSCSAFFTVISHHFASSCSAFFAGPFQSQISFSSTSASTTSTRTSSLLTSTYLNMVYDSLTYLLDPTTIPQQLIQEWTLRNLFLATTTIEDAIKFLVKHKLLANCSTRTVCHRLRTIHQDHTKTDSIIRDCPNRLCRSKKSIREGSFFSGSQLSLVKLLTFIYCWTTNPNIECLYSTLRPSIISTCSNLKFQLKMAQCSI